MFSWGIFSGLIAAPINSFLGAYIGELAAFTAAFIEEPVKALGLYVFLTHPRFRDEFNSPLDGVIYGFAVGMGFYASENFLYYLNYDVGTLLIRILLCWGHGLWVAIVGLWIAVNRHNRGYNVPGDILPGLSVAIFLHFLWNTWGFIPLFGGRMTFYQALFQFAFLKKLINEGKRDEMMRGGDMYVFSPLDRESADRRSHTKQILALVIILGVGSVAVRGNKVFSGFSDEWIVYDFMGFSFEYPERLWVETHGFSEGEDANEEYGEIWFGNYKGRTRELLLVKYGSESRLPHWNTSYASDLVGDSVQLGEKASFTVYGHDGLYSNFTMVKGEDSFNCVASGWLCDSGNRVFYVQYYTQDTDSYETWCHVIESFVCHNNN
jgi:hypothetical protein